MTMMLLPATNVNIKAFLIILTITNRQNTHTIHTAITESWGTERERDTRGRTLTGLAVGEDAGVVSREGIVEDVHPDGREDRLLRGEGGALAGQGVEAVVEGERLGLLAAVEEQEWEQ